MYDAYRADLKTQEVGGKTMPEIDLRFSANDPLNLLASDLRTSNKV
jgi:hypothetical protein